MQEAIFNPLIIFLKWANKPTFFHSFIIRKHLKHSVYMHILIRCIYCNDPKFLDRYAWANCADPDQTAPWGKFENLGSKSLQISVKNSLIMPYDLKEQSDLGLHCLPFCLHRLDSILYSRILEWLQQIFWVSEYLGNLQYFGYQNSRAEASHIHSKILGLCWPRLSFCTVKIWKSKCCNSPKNWTVCFYHMVMDPKDTDGMLNSVDLIRLQSDLGLQHTVCPDLSGILAT